LISSAESVLAVNPVGASAEYVSLMNPGWFLEQVMGFGATLLTGQRLNFAESVETSQKDFREISPNTLVYPSHLWNRLARTMQANIDASSRVKRMLLQRLLPLGYGIASDAIKGKEASPPQKALYFIANLMGFRPLRDKHGLDHVRYAYSVGGKALSQEDIIFFRAIGVPLRELYASIDKGIVTTPPEEADLGQQFI